MPLGFPVNFPRPVEVEIANDNKLTHRQNRTYHFPQNATNINVVVPAGSTWFVNWILVTVRTSAAVGNRYTQLLIQRGNDTIWHSSLTQAAAASQTRRTLIGPWDFADDTTNWLGTGNFFYYRPIALGPWLGGDEMVFGLNGALLGDSIEVLISVEEVTI